MTQLQIGTHDGHFHCDEVLACFLLKQLPEYRDAEIVRTRDPSRLEQCHVVVDVGGVFDAESRRFDHHQRSFTETFASLRPGKPWKIKLSSAGLVYVHYGRAVIENMLRRLSVEAATTAADSANAPDATLCDSLFDKLYDQFVKEIDAIDNGVEIAPVRNYDINTNLSARVGHLNPAWNDAQPNETRQFEAALRLVGAEFEDRLRYYALAWWPARSLVAHSIANRLAVHASGSVLRLDTAVPWKSHLFELEAIGVADGSVSAGQLKYALYPDGPVGASTTTWRVQCVPLGEHSFTNRLSLPAAWCGVRDQALSELAGIEGCVFVHANGFIGANRTYEGALAMLDHALKLGEVSAAIGEQQKQQQ